jgi:hypothetical protein
VGTNAKDGRAERISKAVFLDILLYFRVPAM